MVLKEDIKHIAGLCKLKLSEEELESFKDDFCKIIDYVDQLREVNTERVAPTYYMENQVQILREDIVGNSLPKEDVIKNAPEEQYGYFKMLRVMD